MNGGLREAFTFAHYLIARTRWRGAWALALLVLAGLAEGVSLLLLAPLLQLMQTQGGDLSLSLPGGAGAVRLGLATLLVGFCLLVIVQALVTRTKNIVLARVLYTVVNDARKDLFESIGRARWQFIADLRQADLTHMLTADVDRIQIAAFNTLQLIQSFVFIAIYAVASLILSPEMTLYAGLIGAFVLAILAPVRRAALRYGAALTEQRREQYRIVTEFLSGMKVAKSFNAERRYFDDLGATLARTEHELIRFTRTNSAGGAAAQITNVVAMSIFAYVAIAIMHLAIARVVVLVLIYMRMAPRFSGLQGNLQDILVNAPALASIEALKARCAAHREELASGAPAPRLAFDLRFDHVSFRYDKTNIVREASFTAPARGITALVGPSGAGKSTLADLTMGLLTPESGAILIDGVALTGANRRAWRDTIAYVPQDAFLLHDTIASNLRLGAPDATEEDIWRALAAAQAERFVRALPEALCTIVGDRGAKLSGGERQRIALARALLRRPQLLVLDEATSALDRENQDLINRAIIALKADTTILIVAHSPAAIACADFIVTVKDGAIVLTEFGVVAAPGAP